MSAQCIYYLASPYSDPNKKIEEQRYQAVCQQAALLMRNGILVFSPIAHCHGIAKHGGLPGSFDFWQDYDTVMISKCDELWILTLPGWIESKGITSEIEIAELMNKPVRGICLGQVPDELFFKEYIDGN